MADLLATRDNKKFSLTRGQTVEGTIIAVNPSEVILDLGIKSEGVLQKRDLSVPAESLKVGDKLEVLVVTLENESGQAVVTMRRYMPGSKGQAVKWDRFDAALSLGQILTGKGIEVNKGGLIVDVSGTRGFLPSSQISLSQASDLEELVGKNLSLTVIEVDPDQNRLIFSQKTDVSDNAKKELGKLNVGDKVSGKVAAVLPFGVFVTLDEGIEGLVHISEIAWEKVEDLGTSFKVGDAVDARVISVDPNTNRVNLSVKQLSEDPFTRASENFHPEDVVKGTVGKVAGTGIHVILDGGVEGFMHTSKLNSNTAYNSGDPITCLVDSVDIPKRRVNVVPFITSTSGLVYK